MAQTIEEDVVAVVIKTAKLTREVFEEAVEKTMNDMRANKNAQGKQTLKQLIKDGSKLQNIEVSEKNIKSFEESAKAYGVDYALKKLPDKENPQYVVFFKGKDTQQVYKAFKHYEHKCTQGRERPSVQKEINELTKSQAQSQDKNRQRARENKKDRGMEH